MTRKMLMAALLMAAFSQGTQAQDLTCRYAGGWI